MTATTPTSTSPTVPVATGKNELQRALVDGCLELYRRADFAQGEACSPKRMDVGDRKAALRARLEQEERVGVIQEALKTGDVAPYEAMLVRDALAAKPVVGLTASAEKAGSTLPQVRQEGAAESTVYRGQPQKRMPPASFEEAGAVIRLARRLAIQNYHQHVEAAANARTTEQMSEAVTLLVEAEKAARLADSALQSLVSAQAEQRATTVSLLRGDPAAASQSAKTAGHHMDIVADKLERYGTVGPRGRFFQGAMNAVMKADELAGRVEAGAARTVESFSKGLVAFAQRLRELSASAVRAPAVVADIAKTSGVTVGRATASAYTSLSTAIGGFVSRQPLLRQAPHSAWLLADDAAQFAAQADGSPAGSAVDGQRHLREPAGLAGGLLGRIGAQATGGDAHDKPAVDEQPVRRRPKP